MSHEEAEKWCEKNGLRFFTFPLPAYKEHNIPARTGWDVSGWVWPKDRCKPKVRIHQLGASLVEAVEKAKQSFDVISNH
jgi:hypothetical protein